jgi:hypothetical protein
MIGRSTPRNEEIRRTTEDTAITENNTPIRRKGDPSDAPTMQKNGVRSIAPIDMILKSAKLFWIIKRCCLQQCRHPKISAGENKRQEMLAFEVVSFDIRYNCILRRSFLLKFMVVIHTAYTIVKMSGPIGVITLKSDQRDALSCENASLTHAERFGKEEAQKLAAMVAKTYGGGGGDPAKTVTPGP